MNFRHIRLTLPCIATMAKISFSRTVDFLNSFIYCGGGAPVEPLSRCVFPLRGLPARRTAILRDDSTRHRHHACFLAQKSFTILPRRCRSLVFRIGPSSNVVGRECVNFKIAKHRTADRIPAWSIPRIARYPLIRGPPGVKTRPGPPAAPKTQ